MSLTRLMQLFVFSVILVLIVWIAVATIHYWSNRSEATVSGRILARSEWPESLVELLKAADRRHIKVGNIRVCQIAYDEYYWTSEASPELLTLMSERWRLCAVKESHKLVRRFRERMPTSLVSSSQTDGIEYFVSSDWLAGEKGHLYCAMNNKTNRVLVVRYYYNF